MAAAVSMRDGARYASLPVAFLYTRARVQACSCGSPDPNVAIMADASLRRGDRFMTESGFMIYRGDGAAGGVSRKRFTPLARTPGVPARERKLLVAMERVSLPRRAERLTASLSRNASYVALGPPRAAQSIALR